MNCTTLILLATESVAPSSGLSHMLNRVKEAEGGKDILFTSVELYVCGPLGKKLPVTDHGSLGP